MWKRRSLCGSATMTHGSASILHVYFPCDNDQEPWRLHRQLNVLSSSPVFWKCKDALAPAANFDDHLRNTNWKMAKPERQKLCGGSDTLCCSTAAAAVRTGPLQTLLSAGGLPAACWPATPYGSVCQPANGMPADPCAAGARASDGLALSGAALVPLQLSRRQTGRHRSGSSLR